MATRAEQILAKAKQIQLEKEREEAEKVRLKNELERARIDEENKIDREKLERTGVVDIFKELESNIPGSIFVDKGREIILILSSETDNYDTTRWHIKAYWCQVDEVIEIDYDGVFGLNFKRRKRLLNKGLHICGSENYLVGQDGSLDELIAKAILDPYPDRISRYGGGDMFGMGDAY